MDNKTLKIMRNMRTAESMRREREALEAEKARERELREQRAAGYRQGSAGVKDLARMIEHPVAKMVMEQAGREMGRMVAQKAEEEGTPGQIAMQCAVAVWDYIQKTGAPLEETIRVEVYHRMEMRDIVLRVDVPAMTLEHAVTEMDMKWMRG